MNENGLRRGVSADKSGHSFGGSRQKYGPPSLWVRENPAFQRPLSTSFLSSRYRWPLESGLDRLQVCRRTRRSPLPEDSPHSELLRIGFSRQKTLYTAMCRFFEPPPLSLGYLNDLTTMPRANARAFQRHE